MVVYSPFPPETPPLEDVVVYRKPAGSDESSSEETTMAIGNMGLEKVCIGNCSIGRCLLIWGGFVALLGLFPLGVALLLFFVSDVKGHFIVGAMEAVSGAVVLTSGILTLFGTCTRSYSILRCTFFFIIGILVSFVFKTGAIVIYYFMGIFTTGSKDYEHEAHLKMVMASTLIPYFICALFFLCVPILILIKRARG